MKKILAIIVCYIFLISACSANGSLFTFGDETITDNEIFSAPKTILFLWTSQCPYCISELVNLNSHPEFEKDISFYYINLGDKKYLVERVALSLKLRDAIKKKIILDPTNRFAEQFDISGVPTFIFLRNGKVVDHSFYLDAKLLKEIYKSE